MREYIRKEEVYEIGKRFGYPVQEAILDLPIVEMKTMEINGKEYTDTEAAAAAYIKMLLHILEDARPVLSMAFFADFKMQHKADTIMFEIDNVLKGDKKL